METGTVFITRPTFNRFASPSESDLVNGFRDGPVLVSDLDQSHRNLGSRVRSLQHVCSSTCYKIFRGRTDNDCLRCHCGESVDVGTNLDLYDVIFRQGL